LQASSVSNSNTLQRSHEDILNDAYSVLEGLNREEVILNELQKFAAEDPEKAIDWVMQMAPDKTQKKALSMVFSVWGRNQPDNAASWIMQDLSLSSTLRTTAAVALATSWVVASPNKAMQWADSYFSQTDDYFPFQDAIIAWSKKDIHAVAQHVENSSYGGATSYIAIMDFFNIYTQTNLNEARKWAQDHIPQDFQPGAQVLITRALAKTRPSDAALYILESENTAYFRSNLGPLLSEWTKSNITAASAWVDSSLNDNQKDIAYEHLAMILQFEQPQLAIQYAQALSDNADKVGITTDILIDWREQARDEADQWISENIDTIDPAVLEEVGYKVSSTSEP
jgi:hypothetical protein